MDTISYVSSCRPTKDSESQQNHHSICTFNFWSQSLTENYVNSYSIWTLLKKLTHEFEKEHRFLVIKSASK